MVRVVRVCACACVYVRVCMGPINYKMAFAQERNQLGVSVYMYIYTRLSLCH